MIFFSFQIYICLGIIGRSGFALQVAGCRMQVRTHVTAFIQEPLPIYTVGIHHRYTAASFNHLDLNDQTELLFIMKQLTQERRVMIIITC